MTRHSSGHPGAFHVWEAWCVVSQYRDGEGLLVCEWTVVPWS